MIQSDGPKADTQFWRGDIGKRQCMLGSETVPPINKNISIDPARSDFPGSGRNQDQFFGEVRLDDKFCSLLGIIEDRQVE